MADEQGDIYVSIFNEFAEYPEEPTRTVRLGGPASGHSVPTRIHVLLMQVAAEFDKYKDCRFENEAWNKSMILNKKYNPQ